ncbi:hypothetical protein A3A76_05480 [Candidatus Woesebacteria bacterium RIFCSPLOWO2_01_FULL_39_23]|uniref:Uncharacterized protein n=1 Tax=Candidatus Woesebacteria bacterium RIFCSPHIGHO2_01_FULL_40_22 TaxID=1802499 RepID=A0A1F7YKN6_9BACT|nr:MAG: hypothetical protein A2141_03830 [Candidatus Woesebacteria bacterium RBG_16_40_11]OGM27906.1 MAG: hypothetical protein A2628_03405 [Candidatus Woesebacteria bacterium RIFCSPHIGHO2_01_FULL_40_22]OGM38143.1 MAG: hypothetical protein A3E41_00960 [Candidatus Woesebacteria bacterium RIFCSPHIGHO2_12_FULL_38_9]OGM61662.1 MAG: hypothetical protein A3A76_05480 [Candidatus Woesebacteria bacterium RIFCSPLOWO2_01_FULL_39_23]
MDEKIKKYIEDNLAKGFTKEDIRGNLLAFGLKRDVVDNTFKELNAIASKENPPKETIQPPSETKESVTPPSQEIPVKTEQSEVNLPSKGRGLSLVILLFLILSVGLIVLVIPKLNLTSSNKLRRSSSVSEELENKYMPIWQQLYLEENKIDEEYFKKHIIAKEVDLKVNQLGENLWITYEFEIDWVTLQFIDGILIKPMGADHFYSLEELKDAAKPPTDKHPEVGELVEGVYYQINPIVKIDSIITKKEAEAKLKSCDPELKPAPSPIKFGRFEFKEHADYKTRLLYRGMMNALSKTSKMKVGEVDLSTGEVSCTETTSLLQNL